MKKVLFVCLGNICRSPMAEAIFRERVAKANLEAIIMTESRATSNWNMGKTPHSGTREVLERNQVSYAGMVAELIQPADFKVFDYILAMDQQNVTDLLKIAPQGTQEKVHLFLSLHKDKTITDVPDPYFTGDFEQTYKLIDEGTAAWMEEIKNS